MNELEKLFRSNKEKYVKNVRNILKLGKDNAEDIVQEAMCKAVQYLPSFKPERGKIEAWFSGILFNELRRFIRKEKKHNHQDIDRYWWIQDEIDYESLIQNLICFDQSLIDLKNKDQEIIKLVYLQGYSIKESSKIANVPETNVKQICHRFKLRVREDDVHD